MAVMKGGGEVKPAAIAGEGPVIRKLIEVSDAGANQGKWVALTYLQAREERPQPGIKV